MSSQSGKHAERLYGPRIVVGVSLQEKKLCGITRWDTSIEKDNKKKKLKKKNTCRPIY